MSTLPFSFIVSCPLPTTIPNEPAPEESVSDESAPNEPTSDEFTLDEPAPNEPVTDESAPSRTLPSPEKNLFAISTQTSQKRYHTFKHKYRTLDLNAIYKKLDDLIENTTSCNSITYTHTDPVYCFAALKWIIENGYIVHFWGKKHDKYVLVFGLFYE